MKKSRGGILSKLIFFGIIVVIIAIILKFGLGGGFGGQGGDGDQKSETTETTKSKKDEPKDDEIETIKIEVKQDKYLLEGVEVSLDDIREKIKVSTKKVAVTLENNYASAKIWDEIKNALSELGISVVEE